MAETIKTFWAGMPIGLYIILILAILIGVAGFIVPPVGIISGSLLKFIALILGASWLFYITANIPTILANGAKIRAEYGNAKLEIGRHRHHQEVEEVEEDEPIKEEEENGRP